MMDSCSSGGSQYKVLGEETQCQKAGEWCFLDERAHSIASLMKARNLKLREVRGREKNLCKLCLLFFLFAYFAGCFFLFAYLQTLIFED